jgi:hypothetical protein
MGTIRFMTSSWAPEHGRARRYGPLGRGGYSKHFRKASVVSVFMAQA